MARLTVTRRCDLHDSFRVQQIAGLFDVPLARRTEQTFEVDMPPMDDASWTLGAIVGPSGSGKTTVAREAFGDAYYETATWARDKAVVDGFGDAPIKTISQTLTAVGFSSPPAWIRPYEVLSNGERFRCDLARALLSGQPLVVFDEFTSVVDRTVAKIGSAAVAKSLRSGRLDKRFVAVTCHYDVLEWLEPDWVLDMATCQLARGCLQRPENRLHVVGCTRDAWKLFARHHYLTGKLPVTSRCFMAFWHDRPVAFCAVVGLYGFKNRRRISRIVTLPDYQGIGIGARLMERVCQSYVEQGMRINITASHPAIIGYCRRSAVWRTVRVSRAGNGRPQISNGKKMIGAAARSVVSFEYVGMP